MRESDKEKDIDEKFKRRPELALDAAERENLLLYKIQGGNEIDQVKPTNESLAFKFNSNASLSLSFFKSNTRS
jgi:hypothetical protein